MTYAYRSPHHICLNMAEAWLSELSTTSRLNGCFYSRVWHITSFGALENPFPWVFSLSRRESVLSSRGMVVPERKKVNEIYLYIVCRYWLQCFEQTTRETYVQALKGPSHVGIVWYTGLPARIRYAISYHFRVVLTLS